MSETGFQIAQQVISIVEILVYGYAFAAFVAVFAEDEKERRRIFLAVLAIYVVFYVLRLTVLDIPAWAGYVLVIVCLVLIEYRQARRQPVFLIFLAVTWYCVQQTGILITDSLYTAGNAWMDQRSGLGGDIEKMLLRIMCLYAVTIVLRILLVCAMIWFIGRKIRQCMWQLQARELLTLLVLPVAGVLFGRMILCLQLYVEEDYYFILYEKFPLFLWMVPVTAMLFYVGIWASISGYSRMLDLQEERRQRFVEQKQYDALNRRLNESRAFYEEAHSIRHELRGHMAALDGLLENENYAGAKKYLRQMREDLRTGQRVLCTGNELLDVIVSDAAVQAGQKNIKFSAKLSAGELPDAFAYDLGIILSNLLTNAAEACEKEPEGWIKISGGWQKRFFVLQVSNPCSSPPVFDQRSRLPRTSKEDARLHGIGLKNVEALTKKYFGSMDVMVENQVFYAVAMLQEQEE